MTPRLAHLDLRPCHVLINRDCHLRLYSFGCPPGALFPGLQVFY